MVSLTGHFPQEVYVWFGDSPAIIFFQSDNWILVRTPRQAAPGLVDVTLRRIGIGIVLTAPNAYTFLAADEEPLPVEADPGEPPTTSPGGGSDSGGGDETTGSDPAPAPTPGVTTVPDSSPNTTTNTDSTTNTTTNTDSTTKTTDSTNTTTTTDSTDTTTTTDPTPETTTETDPSETNDQPRNQRQARATLRGDPIDLGNGLTGRALDGLSAIGGVPACTSDPCRTQRIGADDGSNLQSSSNRGRFSGKLQRQRSGQKGHNDQ